MQTAFSQDVSQQKIINSNNYYWGEGCAANEQEASDKALGELASSIAVQVSQSFKNKITEESNRGDSNVKEKTTSVVQTHSSATIKNAQTIKQPADCGINVFHYIPKEQVTKIFEARKQLVRDIYNKALEYEEDGNYAYALKWYYFSIILMNSVPTQAIYKGAENLLVEVPAQISDIIQNIRFEIVSDKMVSENEREILLHTYVGDQKAQTLDFSFWDGSNQVHVQARDGKAYVQLYGSSVNIDPLNVQVKYQYYQQRGEISKVKQLWGLVSKPTFDNSKTIKIGKPDTEVTSRQTQGRVNVDSVNAFQRFVTESGDTVETNQFAVDPRFMSSKKLLGTIDTAMIQKASSRKPNTTTIKQQSEGLYTMFNNDEGEIPSAWMNDAYLMSKLNRLEEHNNLDLVGEAADADINETYDGWELRYIPGTTSYETLNIQSSENVVPDYNEQGTLIDVNFGVMDGLYKKFQKQAEYGNDWKQRQVIVKFMEKYRTAFLTRDLEQLKALFAEEAVIIVGRVLQQDQSASQKYKYEKVDDSQPNVEYLRLTREEYLSRQATLFDTKEDIYLGFSTFNIFRKNNEPGVYGISLRQHYNSTGYSDEGYLFLLVDFNGDKPKIYVRSWQPQEWSEDALIDMANFNISF